MCAQQTYKHTQAVGLKIINTGHWTECKRHTFKYAFILTPWYGPSGPLLLAYDLLFIGKCNSLSQLQ